MGRLLARPLAGAGERAQSSSGAPARKQTPRPFSILYFILLLLFFKQRKGRHQQAGWQAQRLGCWLLPSAHPHAATPLLAGGC